MISEKEAEALERIGDGWNNAKELGSLDGLIPWLENRGLIDVREEHSVSL